jgi:flagellar protein FliO/FliZ
MDHRPTDLIRLSGVLPITATLAGTLAAWPVFAQSAPAEIPGVSGSVMLQMLLGLAFIIGLLFFGAYFLRRVNGGRSFGNNGPLKVVGGLMLSPRERIVLIEVDNEWIVVGIVPGQIKTLHTLPKGELPLARENVPSFSQWLKQIAERKNENK